MDPSPVPAPQVFVVEASAGSGKTRELAKRYLSILFSAGGETDPLRETLAITFTNKAAAEMKERILRYLKQIALGDCSSPETATLVGELGLDPAAAPARAERLIGRILRRYHHLQVRTIDSFVNMVLSGCAFRLDLSSRFRIRTDPRRYLALGLETLLDRAAADRGTRALFDRFLRSWLTLERARGWLPAGEILAKTASIYDVANAHGRPVAGSGAAPEALDARRARISGLLSGVQRLLPDSVDRGFAKTLAAARAAWEESRDIRTFAGKKAFLGSVRLRKGSAAPPELEQAWDSLREDIAELAATEARAVFDPYAALFGAMLAETREIARTEDILFMEELNRKASALFAGDGMRVEELYLHIATRLRHHLVDEFQDTSRLQWRNLFPLIDEAIASGGTFFYVGDKKQALYGWRGGDPSLFDEIADRYGGRTDRKALNVNHRSRAEIVAFNNAVFAEENLRRFIGEATEAGAGDAERVLAIYRHSEQTPVRGNGGGYVAVRGVPREDDQDAPDGGALRRSLVAAVRETSARCGLGETAVLVRTNEDVARATRWLLDEGIPAASDRTLDIRSHPLVSEIVSLLAFLNSPIDDVSFAHFILGSVFAADTAGTPGMPAEIRRFAIEARNRRAAGGYLYTRFRDRWPGLWESRFLDLFRSVGFVPTYELAADAMERFRVLERFPEAQAFFMAFLEIIRRTEEDRPTLADFIEFFRERPGTDGDSSARDFCVSGAATDAVRVTTIHKAKGLQFEAVIVPGLAMDIRAGSGGPANAHAVWDDGESLRMVRLMAAYVELSPEIRRIRAGEVVRSLIGELNTVYVALTRARRELHVVVEVETPAAEDDPSGEPAAAARRRKPNPILRLLPGLPPGNLVERGRPEPADRAATAAEETFPPARLASWTGLLEDEFVSRRSLLDRAALLRGETVHAILARIGNLAGTDPVEAVRRAATEVRTLFPDEGWEEAVGTAAAVAAAPALRMFFDAPGAEIAAEMEMADGTGRIHRPDRVVLTGREALIADFKTSAVRDPAQEKQVRRYCAVARELWPERTVRGFVIAADPPSSREVAP